MILAAHFLRVHEHVAKLSLLGHAEIFLLRLEVGRDLGVGRRHVRQEAVHRERHHRELHLVVPATVFGLELLVGHRQPLGDRLLQLVDEQRAPDPLFELLRAEGRPLHAEDLAIALLADERAVFLKGRIREDALLHFFVVDGQADAHRLRQRGALVDHLLEDLLVHAQLLQQLIAHLPAELLPVGLHLGLVRPAELVARDLLPLDDGDRVSRGEIRGRRLQEVRNVENDKRQTDQPQAPLEPVPVPAHPIEHRHEGSSETVIVCQEVVGRQASKEGPCGIFAVYRAT